MADETTLNPKEAEISIYQLVKILKRMLKDGNTVQLDDLGTFYLTAASSAPDTEAEVSAKNLTGLNIRFRPDKAFQEENQQITIKKCRRIEKQEIGTKQQPFLPMIDHKALFFARLCAYRPQSAGLLTARAVRHMP